MRPIRPTIAAMALLLLAACATQPDPAQPPRLTPTALHLTVTGDTAPVLGTGTTGQIELTRDGAAEPVSLEFENGALAVTDLQPGQYNITRIGQLTCRGLTFEVDPSARVRALGTLRAKIITTDYYVALMSGRAASEAEIAGLAEHVQAAPETIDPRPITVTETAPCYLSTGGPGTTWRERPLGEKILLGIGFAGFCAIALASGGLCAF
jgi:hypothetical protein